MAGRSRRRAPLEWHVSLTDRAHGGPIAPPRQPACNTLASRPDAHCRVTIEHPAMSEHQQQPLSRSSTLAIGALAAAAGGYFVLVALGLVPPPGRRNPHDPTWILFCAGLVFLAGGLAILNGALAGAQPGRLPADT